MSTPRGMRRSALIGRRLVRSTTEGSYCAPSSVQIRLTRCAFHKPAADYRGCFGFLHALDAGKPYPSLDEELQALDTSLKGGV